MNSYGVDGATPGAGQDVSPAQTVQFRFIGILHHPKKPESSELAEQIGDFLRAHGVGEIWHESAWESEAVMEHLPNVDLLITLGGDGTLLRAARLGARHAVPMLGVKMGRLGFLAEIQPDDWQRPLLQMLGGDYWTEKRLMVRARVYRPSGSDGRPTCMGEYDALNDVVLSRGGLARVVRISAKLDGGYLTTYTCDGLIVSTATGSTGYALAVDGPILPPELRNILVIPIAPHLSMDRAVVLAEGTEICLEAYSDHEAMLTVDGQFVVEVQNGDTILVTGSPHLAQFIRLRERSYFYQALMEKLRWPDRNDAEA
jgi:NAD+ kinase